MRILSLLFLLLFSLVSFGQQLDTIAVSLDNVTGVTPFTGLRRYTSISEDSVNFKGIPADVKDYKIKELTLKPSDETLFILYGITKSNKRIVLFDTNFDRNFLQEKVYLFDYDITYDKQKEKAIRDTTLPVEIKFTGAPSIFVKPNVFNCCRRYTAPIDSVWNLSVETGYHREGNFKVNNKRFKIASSGDLSPYSIKDRMGFFIIPYKQPFQEESYNNRPYTLNQSIVIDNQQFFLDSVSRFGDTVWVVNKGLVEKPVGNREGLYAPNIQTTTLDKQPFNLRQLKGKYVLFDFWGTWCNPCIAMIPKLKVLNEKYKSKGLFLVSIASDQ